MKRNVKHKLEDKAEKMFCRAFQSVMKCGMYVIPWNTPQVLEGKGAIRRLPGLVKLKSYRRVLVVTGNASVRLHLVDPLLEGLEQSGVRAVLFSGVRPDPSDINVEDGAALYRKHRCQAIIAFGGGSAMDCAKGIAARIARSHKSIAKMQGLLRVLLPAPDIFAVPTSSGTGSETTIAAVITSQKDHHKASITDPRLMPVCAVLDPELTVSMSPRLTATSGMDALCHAVEAYTNDTYNTDLERELCQKAVRLIYENLYRAYQDGNDLEARQNMQWAAFHAGRAFTRGSVGYVHALGHPLGSLYGVSHGMAMAMLLPLVLRQYDAAVYKKLAELCDVCGIIATDHNDAAKAEAFISWIEAMNEKMEIPKYPDMLKTEDIDQIAEWAHSEGNPLYPTPVTWTRDEMKQFLQSLIQKQA